VSQVPPGAVLRRTDGIIGCKYQGLIPTLGHSQLQFIETLNTWLKMWQTGFEPGTKPMSKYLVY
jgi:hypothetical protein